MLQDPARPHGGFCFPTQRSVMAEPMSEFIREIVWRGFLHQCTDLEALDAAAKAGAITGYIGFDCTAPSLHVGSMVQIMTLRRLQQAGHRPIVLIGGGTTKIGDPSFRDESRPLLDDDKIAANKAGILTVFEKFLTFGDGPSDAIMVDNDEWLGELKLVPFLREAGRHFSVNRMLSMDSVKLRLDRDQPLTFLEFNYMVLQSYDFVELNRRYGCVLQLGGSDQWGNIVNGVELGRRMIDVQLWGLTTPLITTASGAKMGKTAEGAVWLNADMRSPYDYWQFWRNTEDDDVGSFLRLFTDLPRDEIARLEALEGAELNDAKKILANEATRLCHGEAAAAQAAETARLTFEEGASGEALPTAEIAPDRLASGLLLYEALRECGLAATNGEARRLIKGGGARVNDAVVSDEFHKLQASDLADGGIKLSAGKKRHAMLRVV